MAKKKRRDQGNQGPMGCGLAYTPPSPQKMIRMGAESAAHTAMEAHPKVKKMRNAIADAIESTIKRHLGPTRGGKIGDDE